MARDSDVIPRSTTNVFPTNGCKQQRQLANCRSSHVGKTIAAKWLLLQFDHNASIVRTGKWRVLEFATPYARPRFRPSKLPVNRLTRLATNRAGAIPICRCCAAGNDVTLQSKGRAPFPDHRVFLHAVLDLSRVEQVSCVARYEVVRWGRLGERLVRCRTPSLLGLAIRILRPGRPPRDNDRNNKGLPTDRPKSLRRYR